MMMHRRKYLALALAAGLMAAATPALAQTGTTPKPSAPTDSGRRMMDPISRMLEQREQLKLTDDQVGRLEQIRARYQEKYQAHLEQMRRSREARSALRAGMDSARTEVAAVLTPEQEKQAEAMREQWRREWKEAHRGRHHGGSHGKHEHEDGDSKDG
jgi:Spy/CpxP family protein refolding chaperone